MAHDIQSIRNVVLCGHGSCGKTTLADAFLSETGAVPGNHSVDDGTSICDFDPEEKKHKYSIEAAAIHFDLAGIRFNVIDTPGYPDFIGQVIGPMQAVDTAVIVVNAHSGIEVNTRRVFKEAGKAGFGRIIVINKMDDENVDFRRTDQFDSRDVGKPVYAAQCADWFGTRFQRRRQHAERSRGYGGGPGGSG